MSKKQEAREAGPAGNPDYVKHGSDAHAALIGLRKAQEGETLALDGWTLADRTAYGPQATGDYLHEVLRQKVAELKAGAPPVPQSEDPLAPDYAPPLWVPPEAAASGVVV